VLVAWLCDSLSDGGNSFVTSIRETVRPDGSGRTLASYSLEEQLSGRCDFAKTIPVSGGRWISVTMKDCRKVS
jgi:hypothetical protein